MEFRLVNKTDDGRLNKRDSFKIVRIEPQLIGKLCVLLKLFFVLLR